MADCVLKAGAGGLQIHCTLEDLRVCIEQQVVQSALLDN